MLTIAGRVLLAIGLLLVTGCAQKTVQASTPPVQPTKIAPFVPPPGRFVPIAVGGLAGHVALDTQTGNLCKTWAWESVSGTPKGFSQSIPICEELYLLK